MDRTLATLVDDPVFEFYPARRTLRGRELIEHFHRDRYRDFAASVVDFEVYGEWANDNTAIQEYRVDVRDAHAIQSYRVLSMTPVIDGLLTGERLYCDDGFVHALLGELYDLTTPIGAEAPPST